MEINIKTEGLPEHYGDRLSFEDGKISINMFDGMTFLSKDEAKKLAEALLKYANT